MTERAPCPSLASRRDAAQPPRRAPLAPRPWNGLLLAVFLGMGLALTGCSVLPTGGDAPAHRSSETPSGIAGGSPAQPNPSQTGASPSPATPPAAALAPAAVVSPSPLSNAPLTPLVTVESQEAAQRAVALFTPPEDLWERVRRGFGMPNLEGALVLERERFYAGKPDYIARMTERSRKYLFHIVEELERRGMPSELALLPFVESAFNPQAVSTAKAAGMWQFIPSTGRSFDLKQNAFRDDRRDVQASTRAALDYLQKLHGMFGDWHLALAAYNWGEGSVGRAIARNQRAGQGTAYTDLTMPTETRHYVPKLQALKNIVANPQAFAVELPFIANHAYFQSVPITRDIDVTLAARLADVRIEDFRALNPSAHRPVILAAGTPEILLPWDNATVFQRNLEAYDKGQTSSWTAWVAPANMSVAEAAKRTGMSEAQLREVNHIPARMRILAGSSLLVARNGQHKGDVSESIADNGQLSLAPERPPAKASGTKGGARKATKGGRPVATKSAATKKAGKPAANPTAAKKPPKVR